MPASALLKSLLSSATRWWILAVVLASPASAQLSFEFNFTDSNSGFNDPTDGAARRAALEAAATNLSRQLPIKSAVTITFDVSSNNANDSTLASAGSDFVGDNFGFFPTIAHRKIIDGTDGNGSVADGQIEWNFFHAWDLDDDVAADSFDFISTAMHEILHAIGFTGAIAADGSGLFDGAVGEPNAWHLFDQFLVDASGNRLISDAFAFVPAQLGTLTGGSSVFFNGNNTLAANGGNPVVIYSPNPWEDGSSLSHTDDATYVGSTALLMNAATDTGPGVRTISDLELAMLRDLGYEFSSGTGPGGDTFAYLTNLSVRTLAGSGAQTLIAGFAVGGGDKALLVRGVGPTLGDFGVTGALADPRLGIFLDETETQSNDDWEIADAAVFSSVGAFALRANSLDAALTTSLGPDSYTVQISGNGGNTGIALAELYDTALPSSNTGPRLTNVSARSQVGTGDEVLVAGFVIGGTGTKSLLFRGVGPTLVDFGVTGVLADPQITLFRTDAEVSTQIGSNDNWDSASITVTADRVGAFKLPLNSLDAALLVNLAPGTYTVQLSGASNGTGVGLIEVYDAD